MREWESHPPVEVYEASLCALVEFPAINWWSRWVTLPHQLACKASALLVCHDPIYICSICDLAGRLGAAPSKLSFGDSAARLVLGLSRNREWNGAVAGSRTRTCALAQRHSPLKSQPRKLSGPGVVSLPAHAISTKNKHLLLSCDTNPRFHGGSFGVLGHTSCEALNM